MKKNKDTKHSKPIDSYLAKFNFGTGSMGAFDMSSDVLKGVTTQAVSGLISTALGKNPYPKVFDFSRNTNPVMANGGVQGQPNAEVEGQEVYETPNGEVGEFEGASHEQGGIDVNLPAQTKIFSKRLTQAGKSMASRKLARERSISKIEAELEKRPHDKILKQTLERVTERNKIEEDGDMMIQESTNAMEQARGLGDYLKKYGGTIPKYDGGGTIPDEYIPFDENGNPKSNSQYDNFLIPYKEFTEGKMPLNTQNLPMLPSGQLTQRYGRPAMDTKDLQTIKPNLLSQDYSNLNKEVSTDYTNPYSQTSIATTKDEGYDFTQGDIMGLLGTKVGGTAPLMTTLANKASDTPNINAFLNYGKQGLQTIEKEKGLLGQVRDETLRDNNLANATSLKEARNSARGLNSLRSINELYNAKKQEGISDTHANYAGQMVDVLGQQSNAENQRDNAVMQGEQNRDLADRQDKDNFYTQLNKDFVNYGTMQQEIGKDLNIKEGDKDFLNLLPQMFKYNLGVRKGTNGKWEMYHETTGKTATPQDIELAKQKASSELQTYDFSVPKLGKKKKKDSNTNSLFKF